MYFAPHLKISFGNLCHDRKVVFKKSTAQYYNVNNFDLWPSAETLDYEKSFFTFPQFISRPI